MTCPRCGGSLTTYRLDRHQADSCEECGFVGITRLRAADTDEAESWEDALMRIDSDTPAPAATRTVNQAEPPAEVEPDDDTGGGPTVTRRRD